jgi:hypothetical protein
MAIALSPEGQGSYTCMNPSTQNYMRQLGSNQQAEDSRKIPVKFVIYILYICFPRQALSPQYFRMRIIWELKLTQGYWNIHT